MTPATSSSSSNQGETSFVGIYQNHHDAIYRYFLRRIPGPDVDDAVVETFAIAWKNRAKSPEVDHALPWLYAIARNVTLNRRRGTARLGRLKKKVAALAQPAPIDPETHLVQRAEEKLVIEALHRLRPEDREILRLRAWEDLTRTELAEVFGITPDAADMRVLRALRRLERSLIAVGYEIRGLDDSRPGGAIR